MNKTTVRRGTLLTPTCKGQEEQDRVRKREKWTARGERQVHKVKTSRDDTR